MPCYRKQPYKAGSECNVYLHTQQISINTGISLTKIPTKSHSKHRRHLSNFPCVRSPLSEPKTRRVMRGQAVKGSTASSTVQWRPHPTSPQPPERALLTPIYSILPWVQWGSSEVNTLSVGSITVHTNLHTTTRLPGEHLPELRFLTSLRTSRGSMLNCLLC